MAEGFQEFFSRIEKHHKKTLCGSGSDGRLQRLCPAARQLVRHSPPLPRQVNQKLSRFDPFLLPSSARDRLFDILRHEC